MTEQHAAQILARFPVAGRHVVDVGCGTGALVRRLAELGAHVVGVETGEAPLAVARATPPVNAELYVEGGGEDLPLPSSSADLVVFLYSLHHVPVPRQHEALAEAARVLRPGSRLHVAEPVAQGAYFEVLRWVDDETAVRAAALEALHDAADFGLRLMEEGAYTHVARFADFEEFRQRAVLVDTARAAALPAVEDTLRAAFAAHGRPDDGGGVAFDQPVRVFHFHKA